MCSSHGLQQQPTLNIQVDSFTMYNTGETRPCLLGLPSLRPGCRVLLSDPLLHRVD